MGCSPVICTVVFDPGISIFLASDDHVAPAADFQCRTYFVIGLLPVYGTLQLNTTPRLLTSVAKISEGGSG
ncbi:hypothetical protein X975_26272, partial [Stegodyphus mimosarum]